MNTEYRTFRKSGRRSREGLQTGIVAVKEGPVGRLTGITGFGSRPEADKPGTPVEKVFADDNIGGKDTNQRHKNTGEITGEFSFCKK